jgi:hypothetical protein
MRGLARISRSAFDAASTERKRSRVLGIDISRGAQLAGKRHSTEEIAGKLRQVEALVSEGKTLGEATKLIGVSRQTLYCWRGEHDGGVEAPSDRLRELEAENGQLRRLVTDLLLQKMALEEQLRQGVPFAARKERER